MGMCIVIWGQGPGMLLGLGCHARLCGWGGVGRRRERGWHWRGDNGRGNITWRWGWLRHRFGLRHGVALQRICRFVCAYIRVAVCRDMPWHVQDNGAAIHNILHLVIPPAVADTIRPHSTIVHYFEYKT
jgi:hypothetical protein